MANKQLHQSLTSIFIAYFMSVVLGAIGMGIIAYIGLAMASRTGVVLPANQTENELINLTRSIETDAHFKLSNLPLGTSYLLLDKGGQELQTNMSSPLKKAAASSQDSYSPDHGRYGYFKTFRRPDGSHLIVNYKLRERYRNPWLEQHLPRLITVIIGLLSLGLLVYFILISLFFGRYVKSQLRPIIKTTEKIHEEELDFVLPKTRIKEFDQIIQSLDRLRISLRESLLHSWQLEQDKQNQIAALTHDIKTPLTVIRGNTELLNSTGLSDQQQEFVHYSLKNIGQVETYLEQLSYLAKNRRLQDFHPENINLTAFLEEFSQDTQALAAAKAIKVQFLNTLSGAQLTAYWDKELLKRALMNIVSNAVEHSPRGGRLQLSYRLQGEAVKIFCLDSGAGFSKEALKKGRLQFFKDDKSRSQANHQGLGLTIADNVVRLHGGSLELSNARHGGGQVTITLPIIKKQV